MLLICLSDASLEIDATMELAFDAFHCLWICLLPPLPLASAPLALPLALPLAAPLAVPGGWWLVVPLPHPQCCHQNHHHLSTDEQPSQLCPASSRSPCSSLLSISTSRMHPGPAATPSMVSCSYCTSFLNFLAPCNLSKARAPSHPHSHYHTHTHPALLA